MRVQQVPPLLLAPVDGPPFAAAADGWLAPRSAPERRERRALAAERHTREKEPGHPKYHSLLSLSLSSRVSQWVVPHTLIHHMPSSYSTQLHIGHCQWHFTLWQWLRERDNFSHLQRLIRLPNYKVAIASSPTTHLFSLQNSLRAYCVCLQIYLCQQWLTWLELPQAEPRKESSWSSPLLLLLLLSFFAFLKLTLLLK